MPELRHNERLQLAAEEREFLKTLLVAVLLATTCLSCRAAPAPASGEIGSEAPQAALTVLGGGSWKLADQRGKVVLLDFWATWCKPCQVQALIVEDLHREFQGKEVALFALNSGEDRETVESFVAKKPFGYPVLLDPEDKMGVSLGVAALPAVLIVGKDGKIAFFREGIVDLPTLREELKKAGA